MEIQVWSAFDNRAARSLDYGPSRTKYSPVNASSSFDMESATFSGAVPSERLQRMLLCPV